MNKSVEELKKNIKEHSYKGLYLFCGQEEYLKEKYYKELLLSLGIDMEGSDIISNPSISFISEDNINLEEISQEANTMSFLSEYRIMIFKSSKLFSAKIESKDLDNLKELPPTTIMIFYEHSVDKRSRIYKFIQKKGLVIDIDFLEGHSLEKWVTNYCIENNTKISGDSANLLIRRVGIDMTMLANECNKLIASVGEDRIIDSSLIKAIATEQIENKIFDMINDISNKRLDGSISKYKDLLMLKESPIKILSLINRQFVLLYQISENRKFGKSIKEIADEVGLKEFIIKKNYLNLCSVYSIAELLRIIDAGLEYEELIKTGKIADNLAVELFIVKVVKKQYEN